jgi:hypothetical protein
MNCSYSKLLRKVRLLVQFICNWLFIGSVCFQNCYWSITPNNRNAYHPLCQFFPFIFIDHLIVHLWITPNVLLSQNPDKKQKQPNMMILIDLKKFSHKKWPQSEERDKKYSLCPYRNIPPLQRTFLGQDINY